MDTNPAKEIAEYTIEQDHCLYSEENRSVWQKIIFMKHELFTRHSECIDPAYLAGFAKLGLDAEQIPTLNQLNEALKTVNWSVICIDGYISASIYTKLIAKRVFPISRHIRSLEHIDHSPMPDFIHDVIGHLPMLFTPVYQDFLVKIVACINQAKGNHFDAALFQSEMDLSILKMKSNPDPIEVEKVLANISVLHQELKKNPSELTHLNHMFLWSIEFGLFGTPGNYKCFGAGILSSQTETLAFFHRMRKVLPYSIDVIDYEISFTDTQNQFFVIESYELLNDVLEQYIKYRKCK